MTIVLSSQLVMTILLSSQLVMTIVLTSQLVMTIVLGRLNSGNLHSFMPQTINQSEDNYSINDACTYKGVRTAMYVRCSTNLETIF